jgi:AI-2 transport protein TqsA
MDDPERQTGTPGRDALVPKGVQGATNLFALLVTGVLVGSALFLIGWLSPVLAPIGLGLFVAALAAPLFGRLVDRGRSAPFALVITIGVVVVIGGGIVIIGLLSARSLADSMDTYAGEIRGRFADGSTSSAPAALRDIVSPDALVDVLRAVVDVVVSVCASLSFAIVFAALLLLDRGRLSTLVSGGLGSHNPMFREAPALARAAVTYILMRVRVNAVTALSLLVLMVIVGVDDAILWAVGAFLLSFLPYIGLVLALIPPTILAFAESGLPAAAVIVVGGVVLNLIAENVLEPTLTGRALSLSTWLVFTMFFFWVWLIGPVGALLAMPITVLIVLVLDHNERTRWIAALLSRNAPSAGHGAADPARQDTGTSAVR